MAEWVWEPDDFAALWLGEARDRLPRPLSYTSRFPTMDAATAHRRTVRARYDADQTELIELAFHTLVNSDVRIEITGESTTFGKGSPKEYRIVGARTPHHAVMLTQTADPGPQESVGGQIRGRLFRTEQLPARLANIVPSFPAGQTKPDTFHIKDLKTRQPETYSRNTPRDRFDRLTKQRLDGGGVAGLLTGSPFHHPNPWYTTQWLDIARDGRYLQLRTREHLTIRPATPTDLSTCFATWIERALQRLREDEPDHW
ncbi:ESX secretion-associated protein EspG [Nocardia macrotermitis]|uniref:ESX secretion-associated protein EspG n=1 Tax=Nocardia macrotermitis TaxID=2585198 RepID=A0A7K0D6I1_9NOCA|nr:ESX secretion-associated protein EspG [Nocardia macrotermitis]MQY20444.1 hypothetical protein [Nocardia macrotermitis]